MVISCYMIDNNNKGKAVIAWNETDRLIQKAIDENDTTALKEVQEKVRQQEDLLSTDSYGVGTKVIIWPVASAIVLCIIFILVIIGYVYYAILRPFDKMKIYAQSIASGDFDLQLDYERSNYFGEFTWAFDSMRREVTRARATEKEAIENNKVVIATLSHDIKTPIASIMAYAEGMEANLDNAMNRELYLKVIMRKCAEVAELTNDLLLHSIADLDKLKVDLTPIEICSCISEAVSELNVEKKDIFLEGLDNQIYAMADSKRLHQVMENLVTNARKYAGTNIYINIKSNKNYVIISIQDNGPGIQDADIPFIFDKFYRGSNCADRPGAGLGLYIVRYIMQQLLGEVSLHNTLNGLEVILKLPLLSC